MPEVKETEKKRRSREEIAERIDAFEKAHQHNPSQRQLAEELGIPRSTLQHWLKRKDRIEAEPEVVAFFESSAGVAFLHRLVLAAHVGGFDAFAAVHTLYSRSFNGWMRSAA